jgi:hypothetical protein
VDRQHVVAGDEQIEMFRNADLFDHNRLRIGTIADSCGIPSRRAGRIAPCNFLAVQVGDEPIVVAHPQRERFVVGGVRHVERHAQVCGCVHAEHLRFEIGCHVGGEARSAPAGNDD